MTLHTDRLRKERILIFGPPKSSKTRSWGSIVEQYIGTNIRVHVIDLDFRAPQSLDHITDWEKVVNLYQPISWDDLYTATTDIQDMIKPDEWLVIDQASQAWTRVTEYYIDQVMGKKPHNFFMDFKKGGGKGNPLAGGYGENWNIINALYRDWMVTRVIRMPANVLCVAQAEPVRVGDMADDVNIRKYFGRHGVKPGGQKELGFQMDSILLTGFGKENNSYTLTTVGDTNRNHLVDSVLHNFSLDYLVKIGGWKI